MTLILAQHELTSSHLAHFLKHVYCRRQTYYRPLNSTLRHCHKSLKNIARVAICDT